MSISILENIKQSVISNSSQQVWEDILDTYDSELLRVVVDGDTTPFINELSDSGEDNVGLTALQISNLQSAQSGGTWEIISTATTYTVFPVWAEESGGLSNNNNQWSFGNGATGVIGVAVPPCEVYAMSFHAEVAGTSVSIDLMSDGVLVGTETFNGGSDYIELSSPISFTQGQVLGFRTNTETGTYSDARVTAWCRIPLTSAVGFKGEKGDAGQDGADGVTTITGGTGVTLETTTRSTRVTISAQTNFNNTASAVDVVLDSTTLDQIGVSIASNEITLPQGTYRVTAQISVTSTQQRPNQRLDLIVGGSLYSFVYGTAYIRSQNSHNDASLHIDEIVPISSGGQAIKFQSQGITTITGQVSTVPAGSRILISKLA